MGSLAVRRVLPFVVLAACGGGGGNKQTADTPLGTTHADSSKPAQETAADRAAKLHAAALAIVPAGSTCLPTALKDDNAPRLELGAVGPDAIVCAVDQDKSRLLGAVGCWKVDLATGSLAYVDPSPIPGRNIDRSLDGSCVAGYCLPKDAQLPDTKLVHLAWNLDATKVAMLAGDEVHLFDADSKKHESAFTIRGDKGATGQPTAIYFVADQLYVEANDGTTTDVWQFKSDGTAVGPLVGMGKDDKSLSTFHGSFSILDKNHVAIAERGFTSLTSFEIDSGKRAKAVRKIAKLSCKPDEVEAYWHDGDKVSDKCKGSIANQFSSLIGATAVMGSKSLLVLLRDDRLGELGVLDPKSLAEKKTIKMPWCDASAPAKSP